MNSNKKTTLTFNLSTSLYCNTIYWRSNMALVLAILFFISQIQSGLGMSLQHTGVAGDPAPGRSPGPPPIQPGIMIPEQTNGDLHPTVIVTADEDKKLIDCDFNGPVEKAKAGEFNFTIMHHLFRTDLGLLEGIHYQAALFNNGADQNEIREYTLTSFIIFTSVTSGDVATAKDNDSTNTNHNSSEVKEGRAGQFRRHEYQRSSSCSPSTVKGRLLGQAYVLVNWTLPISNIDQPNVTFRLHYKTEGRKRIFEMNFTFPIRKDCELHLHPAKANLSWSDLPPRTYDCQILFPVQAEHHGLVVDLNRLNVPCASGGYLQFFSKNTTVHQHYRTIHRQTHLCGKLEELQEADRHIYFASSNLPLLLIHGSPVFSLNYRLVDFCYNVTLVSRNGTFDLKPTSSLECTFRIHLPYGNRVALRLQMGPINNNIQQQQQQHSGQEVVEPFFVKKDDSPVNCVGLSMRLYDGIAVWSHCAKSEDPQRNVEIVSRENYVALKVNVDKSDSRVALKVWYRAEPIPEVVQQCAFGWVAIRQFCVSAVEDVKMPWNQAEMECVRRGGHLASVRSEHAQEIIDNLLLNSPGYRDHNAYWIGASDKTYEGDFRWSDGLPFSYSNWFPGWSQHGHYNRQPNDDGLSEQDCVEVRRVYHLPSASSRIAASFHWNDRDCSTPNYFLCERLLTDEPVEDAWPPECNQSVILSRKHPRATVTSPGFPRPYPDNAECDTEVIAPPGYHLVIDFDELVLEKEPSECSYDYLEIIETGIPSPSSSNATHIVSNVLPTATAALASTTTVTSSGPQTPRRLCGDWSAKLKLLRYVSQGSKLRLRFVSDYSHHFGGYKARVSMESAMECADDRLHMFNHSCYLFVSYPEVTWPTAQQICKGLKAQLASIASPEEERFVTSNIRRSAEYTTSAIYWLGGKLTSGGKHEWMDGGPNSYSGWLPGHNPEDNEVNETPSINPMCLGIQWMSSPTPMLPSGLYWQSQKCSTVGGYICKRRTQISGSSLNFNRTLNGSEGRLTSPNYPGNYYNNLNYWIKIVGPERSRLVIQFSKIDIEQQAECLYDYVELKSEPRNGIDLSNDNTARWCGTHDTEMEKFNFVSETNEVTLRFHSDYSISGNGFSMIWQAIDVSACPLQTLTSREGTITSPNYPNFMLQRLDCSITILAPSGRRIWLEITDYNVGSEHIDNIVIENGGSNDEALLELDLNGDGNGKPFRPFQVRGHLTDGAFVSTGEKLQVRLRTSEKPVGGGFKATYKTINSVLKEERIIDLTNITYGTILHLNYPNRAPSNVDYVQHFVAPLGYTILLELYQVKFSDNECPFEAGFIEVFDNYADKNGTKWFLCENREDDDNLIPPAPLSITSYFNTIHIRQKSARVGVSLNGTLRVQPDLNYKVKLLRNEENSVESCTPNPCHNSGKCVGNGARNKCQCSGHFTGMFCALTMCELQPCLFGQCELTAIGYRCHCQAGYAGTTCEQRQKPCESNPCDGRGQCVERGDTFHCRCHAWWEGPRCDRRMQRIPFKPLSERMLHEPFWLGLITVTVVLGFIGLVWCAKRHFPEKLEKLLAEEADRNRSGSSIRGSSIREQLSSSGSGGATAVMVVPSPQQGCPRSLFGRLGIRKPSLLSLTSPHTGGSNSHHHHPSAAATARTFSLDDLLKPPPRRTPSPRKKRNNSTPTKKNAAEKKQILQQLISPAASHQKPRKVSLGELIQLSERKLKDAEANAENKGDGIKETSFGGINPRTSGGSSPPIDDPKLEKKVTFARLLNKVSAEMSSGSEIELGMMNPHENRLRLTPKAASTPPSPATDVRSPHSTSSNQGSDSMSSLDVSLPCGTGSITDLLQSRRSGKLMSGKPVKPASADSILAMFRNFSSTSAGANLSASTIQSPSTTPTASSPQDDAAGDDDSSTSSIHTPLSFSSGPPDSPIMQWSSHSIEVPVLDPLSAHRNQNIPSSNLLQPPTILLELPSNVSKCLSPIRELPTPLPTPLPSPAPTPMRQRSPVFSSNEDLAMDMSDDRISIEIPGMSISTSEGDVDDLVQDIAIDPQAEDGLLQEEAAAMSQTCAGSMFRLKPRPPPVGQGVTAVTITDLSKQAPTSPSNTALSSVSLPPPPLVIPTLIIQQPSPTRRSPPTLIFPGSPPPQRASSSSHETHFPFPGTGTTINSGGKPRRGLLKEFDKPTSLDLPNAPPMITITCNLSEAESDAESISPAAKPTNQHLGVATGTVGMCYLSPFSMCSRADRTASESNLSSSGYSSMASPGPSRCGSNNPLCPSEMEDPGPPGSGPTNLHSQQMAPRRPSPLLKTTTTDSTEGGNVDGSTTDQGHCRGRSDSETLSDDPLIESNDEGIGTDHIDEKIEEGELKSAKELEVFIGKDFLDNGKTLLDLPVINTSPSLNVNNKCGSLESDIDKLLPRPTVTMSSLQLPSIVVQTTDSSNGGVSVGCDKHLSPVSSRSESPLSDKTIGSHFSPQFYGRHKDQLPFTDSDGLYDFPSSDPAQNSRLSPSVTVQHRKSTGRRREKRPSKNVLKSPSPTKNSPLHNLLDVPGKDIVHCRVPTPRKPSPKRRAARAQMVSSSSSSESLNSSSIKEPSRVTSSSPSPDSIRWPSVGDWQNDKRKGRKIPAEVSGEDVGEDATSAMIPKMVRHEDIPLKPHKRISKLRTISHQIRFLRRLELSLKRRERLVSLSDSVDSDGGDDGEESPRASSPLLQPPSRGNAKPELMHKSSSIGRLGGGGSHHSSRTKLKLAGVKNKKSGSQMFIPQDDTRLWTKVPMSGNQRGNKESSGKSSLVCSGLKSTKKRRQSTNSGEAGLDC